MDPRRSILALLLTILGGIAPASAEDAARPTGGIDGIVLITVDTLRADHVGAYGGPVATPALDALAARGVLVEQAFTPTPSTGPAHASLMTGLHPWRHGVLDNAVPLGPRVPTLAQRLQAEGWETAAIVSSYILDARFGLERGFGHYTFEPTESYYWRNQQHPGFWSRGASTTDAALAWLSKRPADAPRFLLWVHYFDPHTPYEPPAGYEVPSDSPVDLTNKRLPPNVRNNWQLESLIRAYRGEVRYVDAQLGRLFAGLDELGLADRVALVLTSDHGEGLGDHGQLEHGANLYDELIHVPLIVRMPGLPAGERRRGPVQLEDVFPTLLAVAGSAPLDGIDGQDLLPFLRDGKAPAPRQAVYGRRKLYRGRPQQFYQRTAERKWIGPVESPGRVFDLVRDPAELRPAGAEGAPVTLTELLAGPKAVPAPRAVDPETRRALEALGYAD